MSSVLTFPGAALNTPLLSDIPLKVPWQYDGVAEEPHAAVVFAVSALRVVVCENAAAQRSSRQEQVRKRRRIGELRMECGYRTPALVAEPAMFCLNACGL